MAIWLEAEHPTEAGQRTAINRAYYAAYHAASAFVRAVALNPPGQPLTHDRVWHLIRLSALPNSAEIAKLGFDLKNARVGADYRNPFPGNLSSEVKDAIANSAAIIALLN
jgi:hypothetical protein